MLLRAHPLLSYHGLRSWPPAWVWTYGAENDYPRGEVGILREVVLSHVEPVDRCFLRMDYKGSSYMGCLLIEDSAFCSQIVTLLQGCCNRTIADIGSLDITHHL